MPLIRFIHRDFKRPHHPVPTLPGVLEPKRIRLLTPGKITATPVVAQDTSPETVPSQPQPQVSLTPPSRKKINIVHKVPEAKLSTVQKMVGSCVTGKTATARSLARITGLPEMIQSNFLPPAGASSLMKDHVDQLPSFLIGAKSASTVKVYGQKVADFSSWCDSCGFDWFPATVTSVCVYLKILAERGSLTLHSFRAGGATAASDSTAKVKDRLVQAHGRWISESVKNSYIKSSLQERLSVTKNIVN